MNQAFLYESSQVLGGVVFLSGQQGAQDRVQRLRSLRERPRHRFKRPVPPRPAGHLQGRRRPPLAELGFGSRNQ